MEISKKKYRTSIIINIYLVIARSVNSLLGFLSLKKQRQFWGIIYDSVSKQPLDPVIVKLVYADRQQVETCVTDLAGRYGFLARPGKFKIFAKKTNYAFPSTRVAGDSDGAYDRLYHGEFFELSGGEGEVVAPNIPMDPLRADWNQTAKQAITRHYPYVKFLYLRLIAVVFWFGFVFTAVYLWRQRQADFFVLLVAGLYLLVFLLRAITPPLRLWGKVRNLPGPIILELRNDKFPNMIFGRAAVHSDGRFFLRSNPGLYRLEVVSHNMHGENVVLGSVKVRVHNEGVVNQTIVL